MESSDVSQQVAEILPLSIHDVSKVFASCESKMVQRGLGNGSLMLALPLPGFSGLIGKKTLDENGAQMPRLGRELAGAAKLAGVAGIFHSDELPGGIDSEFVDGVRSELSGVDAFVLLLGTKVASGVSIGKRSRTCSQSIR